MLNPALHLVSQALHAMAAVLPLRTLLWVTTVDLWIVESAGAPLALVGRLTNRHLYQVLESEDPGTPMIVGHRRALAGEASDFEHRRNGRRWRAAITPVAQAGAVVGCFGTATLLGDLAPASVGDPAAEISMATAADEAAGVRLGDYLWEHADPARPVLLQRMLPATVAARLRAEGKLLQLSPRSAAAPLLAASSPAAPPHHTYGGLALVR